MNKYPEIKINDFNSHVKVNVGDIKFNAFDVGAAIDGAHRLIEYKFAKQIAEAAKKEDSSEKVDWKRHLNGRKR
jgi:hypothetical protein